MPSIAALSLACETASVIVISNYVGMELTFMRQVIARAKANDVVLALATNGGSKKSVAVFTKAQTRKPVSVALSGHVGCEIARYGLADSADVDASDDIPRIHEIQATIDHVQREQPDRNGTSTLRDTNVSVYE